MSSPIVAIRRSHVLAVITTLVVVSTLAVVTRADAGGVPAGEGVDVAYVAYALNFPDALGIGSGAGVGNAPILIVPTDPPLPSAIEAELIRLDPKKVVIVGGEAVISASTQAAIVALLPNATVERIAGADRYATNAAFSASVFPIETWVSIGAPAFTVDNTLTDDGFVGNGVAYNAGDGFLFASIVLPDGAEILEVAAILYDNDDGGDVSAALVRMGQGSQQFLGQVVTSGEPGSTREVDQTIAVGMERVDNELYSYVVNVSGAASSIRYIQSFHVKVRLGAP